jgi:hypothetical protein
MTRSNDKRVLVRLAVSRDSSRETAKRATRRLSGQLASRHVDVVLQAHAGHHLADAMLGELLDVIGRGLAKQANALRREFDAEIAHAAAGASEDARFDFLPETRKIEDGHGDLRKSLPNIWASFAECLVDSWQKAPQMLDIGMKEQVLDRSENYFLDHTRRVQEQMICSCVQL